MKLSYWGKLTEIPYDLEMQRETTLFPQGAHPSNPYFYAKLYETATKSLLLPLNIIRIRSAGCLNENSFYMLGLFSVSSESVFDSFIGTDFGSNGTWCLF